MPSDSQSHSARGSGLPCLEPPAPNRAPGYPRFLGHLLRTRRAL